VEAERSSVKIGSIDMNANVLKGIAILAMFVDHASYIFYETGTTQRWWIHLFGRLAAPIFCYLIAEGHHYTSNRKKYIYRLLLFAAIAHFPYVLYFNANPFLVTSVIWSLAMGLVALTAAKSTKLTPQGKIIVVVLCCLAAYTANWNYIAVIWIVAFGVFRESFYKNMLAFATIAILFYIWPGLLNGGLYETYRLGVLLAIPFFYLYNGKPGSKSKFSKWMFYWFYPIHLLVLAAIQWML
jgi:hypothetical protein